MKYPVGKKMRNPMTGKCPISNKGLVKLYYSNKTTEILDDVSQVKWGHSNGNTITHFEILQKDIETSEIIRWRRDAVLTIYRDLVNENIRNPSWKSSPDSAAEIAVKEVDSIISALEGEENEV